MAPANLVSLDDWSAGDILSVLRIGRALKADPAGQVGLLQGKTLLMIFEKPSLRTRLSFEAGMTRLGGHAIFYSLRDSVFGSKESIEDTARAAGRFVDILMARLFDHASIQRLAQAAPVPVINGLTDFSHPCQILADLLTIEETRGQLDGTRLTFLGDCNNNITHSLLFACPKVGVSLHLACPEGGAYEPDPEVFRTAQRFAAASGSTVSLSHDAAVAVEGADVVYTDTWMSYQVPEEEKEQRVATFAPYQVTEELMNGTATGSVFMHCLPAQRGYEQTAEVIDGPRSIVFDQAENRLWAQNGLLLTLLERVPPGI